MASPKLLEVLSRRLMVNNPSTDEDFRKIGLAATVAKNGRLRAMWRRLANPGSHKCVCGKTVSANKAWEHVQTCQIAQDEFKAARERVIAAAAAAKEAASNEHNTDKAADPESDNADAGANSGVSATGGEEDRQSVQVPEAVQQDQGGEGK
jgi:hypothetical protein